MSKKWKEGQYRIKTILKRNTKLAEVETLGPMDLVEFLQETTGLHEAPQENIVVVALDSRKRVMGWSKVAQGDINACGVQPSEAIRPVILAGSLAAVLVHNHPSGDPTPSDADIKLTNRFSKAFEVVGIELLDHIILGGSGRFTSMAEKNLM